MIDVIQFREHIITPVLTELGMFSVPAVDLLTGTALVESGLQYLVQLENGPARGVYQMETDTAIDIYDNYLKFRTTLLKKVEGYRSENTVLIANELVGNLYFATAMCRIHYRRVKEPIPTTPEGAAKYWKKYYNSSLGKGTEEKYLEAWSLYVL